MKKFPNYLLIRSPKVNPLKEFKSLKSKLIFGFLFSLFTLFECKSLFISEILNDIPFLTGSSSLTVLFSSFSSF